MLDNTPKQYLMETQSPPAEVKDLAGQQYGTKLESRRWLILIAFSIFSASSAMQWITYSPITTSVQEYYGKSESDILNFPNSYMYIYFAFSFLGSWLAYRWFTWSFLGALLLNTVGGWVRYASGHNYSGALFGQYLAAAAQNVVLFVPVLISERWFPVNERTWAVTIGTLANLFGWGFGFLFPTLIVKDSPEQIKDLLLYEAIIASVPLAIGAISIKEKPKVPPSYSAMIKLSDQDSFWKEFLSILKNVKFMIAAICYGNIVGQSYTISSVITLFMENYTLVQQGLVGVVFIGFGIIGGLVATWYLSRGTQENYDPILKAFAIVSICGLVALAFIIHKDSIRDLYILNGVLGVGLLGFQPFACQTLVEMTFPVQESISVNMMMVMGQLFGLIGNYISTANFVGDEGVWSLVVIVAPSIVYIVFFHKTQNNRQKAENEHERIDQNAINTIVQETAQTPSLVKVHSSAETPTIVKASSTASETAEETAKLNSKTEA